MCSIEQPSSGPPPSGTRGSELVAFAELVLAVAANREIVIAVLAAAQDWIVGRRRGRLEVAFGDDRLVLESATAQQQQLLVETFVDRILGC
jgi:hypothetical protein